MSAGTAGGRWALITGASGGIGAELARLAAADGFSLVLVARSEAPLRQLAAELAARHPIEALPIVLDLARPGAVGELLAALAPRGIVPELLMNNAGVGLYGLHAETPLADELSLIDLNDRALVELTKRLLPSLIARGRGRILNVASTAAFQPGPYMAVYYASKAFVLSYSEAIAHELAGTGVSVTVLCPGPTASGFQARARMRRALLIDGGLIPLGEAGAVARAGYRGLLAGRRIVIPGLVNRLMVASVRFAPRRLITAVVAFISRPR